jgi:hypothetical protein
MHMCIQSISGRTPAFMRLDSAVTLNSPAVDDCHGGRHYFSCFAEEETGPEMREFRPARQMTKVELGADLRCRGLAQCLLGRGSGLFFEDLSNFH